MARFTIYSKDSQSKRYSGEPQYHGSYMGVDYVEFRSVSSPVLIPWEIGDYIDYSRTGMRYKLYSLPMPKKVGRAGAYGASFEYSNVQFYAATKELEIAPFRDLVTDDNRIHFSTRPEVATYEDVHGIARRIQACMDDLYPNRWRIEVVETDDADLAALLTETKEFSVSNGSCLDALSQIYELWKNVGWIHTYDPASDKDIITIGKANVRTSDNTTDALAYGLGKGLTSIKKAAANSEEFATRLYVYGSDRNIQTRYYNGFDILNKDSVDIRNLMIPLEKWGKTDGLPDARKAYLQADDEIIEKYGLIPRTIYFDGSEHEEIYPSIVGLTCNKVREAMIEAGEGDSVYLPPTTDDRIDKVRSAYGWGDGSKEDIDGIPTFTMYIRQVGFDIASQGRLTTEGHATISMKSGMCAGREFKVKAFRLYKDNNQPELELEKSWDDSLGMSFPNTLYPISEEDEFVLLDIPMPDYYIKLAEDRLYEAAERLLADYTRVSAFYEPGIDPIRVSVAGKILRAGMYMQVYDEDIVDTGDKKDYVLIDTITIDEKSNPALYSVTLREQKRSVRTFGSLESMIDDAKESAKVGLKRERMYTDRRFRSSEETLAMLKSAFTNFSEGINPVTVNTIALLVGDESLQFKFTKSISSLTDVECPLTYDNTTKQLAASSISYIKHMTLGVSAVSSSRVASEFKGWRIPTYSEVLEDTEARYVYIKASKYSTTGAFVMSKTAIGMEDVSGYYHFLVGVLNSEYNGMRDFVTLYGFTEVLPGQITTDILRSANGNLVIDLANAVISAQNGAKVEGALVIGSGSSGLTNLSEWSGKQQEIDDAKSAADAAGKSAQDALGVAQSASASVSNLGTRVDGIDKSILEINNKLDGVVENYYDDYIPSKDNLPASQWIAEGTEQEHIGDTFTNTSLDGDNAGRSWRWLEKDGIYDWQLITDSDATKALALAAEAKAAADGKTKTFLVTPSNYAEGDLWIVGETVPDGFSYTKGTVLYAVASATTYVADNWKLYVEYAQRSELEQTVESLDQAIADAEKASKDYADEGKAALQKSIDALEDAKADAIYVYTKIEADEHINSAEQRAKDAAQDVADLAQKAAEENANAYADGKVSKAEQNAIDTANNNLAAAKQELEKAIAEVEEIANTADAATKTLEAEIGDVKSGLTESVAEINARLDGVVENYYEEGAPALNKKPVTDWKAASEEDDYELINHVGDTYTNIEEYVDDATTPDAGKSWRWCWCDDSSITDKIEVTDKEGVKRYLHWHPIADSDAVKALLEASKAKTAADGKSKTFVTQPVPPYKEGDLWVQGESGDIYRCKDGVDKTSGSFDSSEWELASKYTDDTKANEAMEEAVAAKEVAETAKAATDALNNDGLFTVAEKRSIRKALKDINPAEGSETFPFEWSVTSKETIEGNEWTEITDKSDNDYGWYVSDMHESDGFTIAKISFRVNVKSDVDVYIKSRAESNYDYTLLSKLDVTLNQSDTYLTTARVADTTRGRQNVERKYTFTDVAEGNHFVTIMYRKDSTANEDQDNGYFKVETYKFAEGSLGDWMSIVQEKGLDIVMCDPAVDAADELFSYLDNTGKVWENVSDEVPEGFRDEVYRLFAAYYKEVSAILVDTATSDLDYLSDAMKKGNTIVDNGLVMTSLVAVGDTENPSAANVGAFMNGSSFAKDTEHGKLMHALGIPPTTEDGDEDLEARSKEAKTRIYEDGTIIVDAPNVSGRIVINDSGFKYYGEDNGEYPRVSLGDTCQDTIASFYDTPEASQYCVPATLLAVAQQKQYAIVAQGNASVSGSLRIGGGVVFAAGGNTITFFNDSLKIPEGMIAGLRPATKVINSAGTSASPNTLTELDFSVLVIAATGTYYIALPSEPLDGQEYVIESLGANIKLTSIKPIWNHYYGIEENSRTFSGANSIRLKYYKDACMWTCSWLDWKQS